MGGDGGSIKKRKGVINVKKIKKKISISQNLQLKYTTCTISQLRLQSTIVCDYYGNLYNKKSVLEYLLKRKKDQISKKQKYIYSHLKSLKDIIELKGLIFSTINRNDYCFSCPLSGLKANGKNQFITILPCGCTYSKEALNSISSMDNDTKKNVTTTCLLCNNIMENKDDYISLNCQNNSIKLRNKFRKSKKRRKLV